MRTIAEIKNEMCEAFMANESLANAYGFSLGATWGSVFSSVSIENLLLYVVAVAIYVLEGLMDVHRKEVEEEIAQMVAHRPKWYRDRALAFLKGVTLMPEADKYDTGNMSDGDIEAAQVVKYAAATEDQDSSLLTIKVAGESGGKLCPLDDETEAQLRAYFAEIKDAGVRINLVNKPADRYSCRVDVYYNALLTSGSVEAACKKAVERYISSLPFNGEYTNMGLVDALQAIGGVMVVELKSASVVVSGEGTPTQIDARHRPVAGYMSADVLTFNMKVYNEQV